MSCTAGNLRIPIDGVGTVRLRCLLPDGSTKITELTNVLYSSELRSTRLFSWPYIRNNGFSVKAKDDHLFLTDAKGDKILWAKFVKGIMEIQLDEASPPMANFSSYEEFHTSMGHFAVPNPVRLYKAFIHGLK